MAHFITALIGSPAALAELSERFGAPAPTPLPFGLVILPLSETRLDAIAMSHAAAFEGFGYLTPELAHGIETAVSSKVLYIETDYFGGQGQQAAALFESGRRVWQGTASTNNAPPEKTPISEGLAMLGVTASEGDEFDAVGLSNFRSVRSLGITSDD